MTTTLAMAPPAARLTLVDIVTSAVQRAGRENRQLRPGDHFGLVAAGELRAGRAPDEAALRAALAAELQLRYAVADVGLTVLGATDAAIAVKFDARPMAARTAGDPIDIITPWAVDLPLGPLRAIIAAMLELTTRAEHDARVLVGRLRAYAAGLPAWRSWPDLDTRLLVSQAVIGNMNLLAAHIDRARAETARDWIGAVW